MSSLAHSILELAYFDVYGGTPMPRAKARSRIGLANHLRCQSVLVVCHPCYSEWMHNVTKESLRNGYINFDVECDLCAAQDVLIYLKKLKEEGKKYDTLVLVPGHGVEPFGKKVKKDGSVETVRSEPYLVWHAVGDTKDPKYLLRYTRLKQVIQLCVDLAHHVHLGTCFQGCLLDLYYDMLRPDQHENVHPLPVLSGWKKGLFADDRGSALARFISRGCAYKTTVFHVKNKSFGYIPW